MNFSEKLSTLRDLLKLNQPEMGKKLGVSRNLVSMMERPDKPRPPSRPVKLNFDHLLRKSYEDGLITAEQARLISGETPTESEFSKIPTESEFRVHEEVSPYYAGGRSKLKIAREAKNLSQKQLADEVGYSLEVYQNIEDGSSNMSRKMAEKVAKVLNIDINELLDGSDHPPANGLHHGTVGETPQIEMPPGQKVRFIPLLSMAQCGGMMAYDDSAYDHSGFVALNPKDGKAFALTLAGDSMTPDIRPGDTAIVYPSFPPRNGCVVIAKLNEENGSDVMLKLYQQSGNTVTLSSYNPAYPPMTFPREAFQWIYPVSSVTRVL